MCGVEETLCQLGLDSLVATKLLYVKTDGVYARAMDGEVSRPRMLPLAGSCALRRAPTNGCD